MITLRGVTRTFPTGGPGGGSLRAVDGVDLHVERGAIQGIIGFSGSSQLGVIGRW